MSARHNSFKTLTLTYTQKNNLRITLRKKYKRKICLHSFLFQTSTSIMKKIFLLSNPKPYHINHHRHLYSIVSYMIITPPHHVLTTLLKNLKALFNNIFTFNHLSCMALHAISVFDVSKWSPEKIALKCFKEVKIEKWLHLPYSFSPMDCCIRINHKSEGLINGDILDIDIVIVAASI